MVFIRMLCATNIAADMFEISEVSTTFISVPRGRSLISSESEKRHPSLDTHLR